MRAIKAFDSDLCATLGKGIMQYEPGKTYKEKGVKGSYIFLIEEKKHSREIEHIQALYVDGTIIKANKYYGLRGVAICEEKN